MKIERRNFLKKMAGVCVVGVGGKVVGGVAVVSGVTAPAAIAATTVGATAAGAYGAGVRAQVFEVIVRQAMAGAPWKEICAGPMMVNKICAADVEAEVERRTNHLNRPGCTCTTCDRTHKESDFCNCEACAQKRVNEHEKYTKEQAKFVQAIENIPHSDVSPCACKQCRSKVNQLLAEIRSSTTQL